MKLAGMTVGRASYEPGWRWSTHEGTGPGDRCQVEHTGMVVSGRAAAAMEDGTEIIMQPGDLFTFPPGHDWWVVGDEPYVSLHFGVSEVAPRRVELPAATNHLVPAASMRTYVRASSGDQS